MEAAINAPLPAADFDRYYEIARGSRLANVDSRVEHPVGTLMAFKALASVTGSRSGFARGVVAASAIADAIIVIALWWGWGRTAAAAFLLIVAPVISLLFNRIDLWSTSCAAVAAAGWQRQRLHVTAVTAAMGGALKLWPLPFLAVLAVRRPEGRDDRAAAVALAAGVLGAIGAISMAMTGWSGVRDVVTFRGATGWQIESLVGSVLHAVGAETLRLESGSWRIGATNGAISMLLFAVGAAISAWSVWRAARANRIGIGWLGGIGAIQICSALLSAQFAGWLAPGAAIAWSQGDRRQASLAIAGIVLTGIFWKWYEAVLQGYEPLLWVVVLRNGVLVALVWMCVRTFYRSSRT